MCICTRAFICAHFVVRVNTKHLTEIYLRSDVGQL